MTQSPAPPPGPPVSSFWYEAQSATGDTLRGTMEAASAVDASRRLTALKLRVLSVTPTEEAASSGGALTSSAPRRRVPRLGPEDFQLFNQQLAHLVAAGMPMERGLRLIAADLHTGRLSHTANAVAEELERGVPLKDAFAHHASRFPPLYARLVDAGVQTADLPAMLFNLGRHLEMISRLRRALWRAFAYPVAVLIGLAFVLLFISLRVLPQFADMYKDFHTTLPSLTLALLALGDIYPAILITVAVVILLTLIVAAIFRGSGRGGEIMDSLGMRLPIIGRTLRANTVARWCDALRLGVQAGLDLPRAMALASDAAGSPRASHDSAVLGEALSTGRPLREVRLSVLPATVPAAFELAAHAGDLPATLATLSRLYERQAEDRLRMLPGVVTPLLMIAIGCFVAVLVMALFLPLIRLVQSVSGGG